MSEMCTLRERAGDDALRGIIARRRRTTTTKTTTTTPCRRALSAPRTRAFIHLSPLTIPEERVRTFEERTRARLPPAAHLPPICQRARLPAAEITNRAASGGCFLVSTPPRSLRVSNALVDIIGVSMPPPSSCACADL